jgi:hypothetical protein
MEISKCEALDSTWGLSGWYLHVAGLASSPESWVLDVRVVVCMVRILHVALGRHHCFVV